MVSLKSKLFSIKTHNYKTTMYILGVKFTRTRRYARALDVIIEFSFHNVYENKEDFDTNYWIGNTNKWRDVMSHLRLSSRLERFDTKNG